MTRSQPDDALHWVQRAESASQEDETEAVLAASLALVMAGRTAEALAGLPAAGGEGKLPVGYLLVRGMLRTWSDDLPGAREDLAELVWATRRCPRSSRAK